MATMRMTTIKLSALIPRLPRTELMVFSGPKSRKVILACEGQYSTCLRKALTETLRDPPMYGTNRQLAEGFELMTGEGWPCVAITRLGERKCYCLTPSKMKKFLEALKPVKGRRVSGPTHGIGMV